LTDAPWFPQYAKDWLMQTVELSYEQKGIHHDLLCLSWERDIPIDSDAVRRLTRCTPSTWRKVWPVLEPRWLEVDGKRINEWLETQRQKTLGFRQAMSEAGRKGAAERVARLRPGSSQAQARLNHTQSQVQVHPQESSLSLTLVAREPGLPIDLSPGQLQAAVPGLVGAWNNLCAVDGSPFQAVTVRSHPKATAALRAHPDINWWADLFASVGASDFLRRDARMAPVDFWWVLDHCEEIAAGRHGNRERQSLNGAALAEVLKDLA
jgi:uncharacterized protein YdaU (DUF1376 family)